jgi:carboxylesterase type B
VNKAAITAGLPVFVYFTGGGFVSYGNPPGPIMDMAYHARYGVDGTPYSLGKAVFVYVNYRISILGFMAHPGMTTPSGSTGGGNIGLADGIAGLQWINANIASFGGDPNQVTIQGSSAGGGYVSLILASPLSVGLIKNVFSMSPYVSYHPAFYSQTMRKQVAQMFMMAVGCASTADVPATTSEADTQIACMKAVPFATMSNATIRNTYGLPAGAAFDTLYGQPGLAMFIQYNFAVAPCLDGYVLDMPPLQAYASGRNSDVTVVMGHQANEYSGLFSAAGELAGPAMLMNVPYQIGINGLSPTVTAKQMYDAAASAPDMATVTAAAYSGFGDTSQWHTNIQTCTDVFFGWGIKAATDAQKAGGMTTYQVLNLFGEPEADWPIVSYLFGNAYEYSLGAYHAAEDNANMGGYLWGFSFITGGAMPVTYSPAEITVATAMSTHWKNIMMGNPPDASWPANSGSKMVYGVQFPSGSAYAPCVRIHASTAGCVTEPTAGFRASQIAYFEDPWNTVPTAPATCAVPFLDAIQAGTSVSGSFGLTLPQLADSTSYSCSACTCSARRNLLFGAPMAPSASCSCA